MRWTSPPDVPAWYWRGRGVPRRFGAPCAIRVLALVASLSTSRWMKAESGRAQCVRGCVWREGSDSNSKESACAPGFLSIAMALRGEFVSAGWRMALYSGNRFQQSYSGASTPSCLADGTRPTRRCALGGADLFRRGGSADEDLLFAQDASRSGQFAQRWKLRMMAQEAALRGAPTASYGG